MIIQIEDPGHGRASQSLRIPDWLIEDDSMAERVEEIWSRLTWDGGSAATNAARGIQELSVLFREEARQRAEQLREAERSLRRGLASLQRQQETHPESAWVETQMAQARQELREVEERRHDFSYHRQASHWARVGDRVSAEFFDITGPRHARAGIRSLRCSDGAITRDPVQVHEIATEFYRGLMTVAPLSEEAIDCRELVWSHTRHTVTEQMQTSLAAPLTGDELTTALMALPRGSCPGEDGLPVAFFVRYWEQLATGMRHAFQEILGSGVMPESLSEGLIHLIPKEGGDREDIRHWRPITLLGTAYKILAKAVSLRLQPFMDELIHSTQTGFVKGRSILDNIFTFWEASALARLRGEDLAILLLDFEKAYDRVDWGFLEGTMLRMGFTPQWIRGVAAMYNSAHSQVLVGGARGDRFALSRSVRQGCPLAPFLFLFFAEAMSGYLSAQDVGLQGLSLPIRDEELLDSEFAR